MNRRRAAGARWLQLATALVAVGAVSVLFTALSGCPKRARRDGQSTPKVEVYRVDLANRTPGVVGAAVTTDALVAYFKKRLRKSGQVYVTKMKKPGAYRIAVELGVRRDSDGRYVALLVARARPHRSGAPTLQSSTMSRLPTLKPTVAQRKAHLMAAVGRIADDLAFQARLARAKPAELVKALGDTKDAARLGAAIEIVAVRRLKPCVPALLALLRDKRTAISDRAIGALVEIRDRRAVRALTRLAKFTDTKRMAKVIDAIGTLGGKEARQYLEFVAVGHPDADIKNLAREALQRMKRAAVGLKSAGR